MLQRNINAIVNKHIIERSLESSYKEVFNRFFQPTNTGVPYLYAMLNDHPGMPIDDYIELILSTVIYDIDAGRYLVRFSGGANRNAHLYVYPDKELGELLFPAKRYDFDSSKMKTDLTRQLVADLCIHNDFDEWSVHNQGYCETSPSDVLCYLLDNAILRVHASDISHAKVDFMLENMDPSCPTSSVMDIYKDTMGLYYRWSSRSDIDVVCDDDSDYEISCIKAYGLGDE